MKIKRLQDLPEPSRLRTLLQSLAMLDAILSQPFGEAVHSFSAKWSSKRSVGVVNNGQGDELFVVFDSVGCFVKGWVHDIAASNDLVLRKQVSDLLPQKYSIHRSEPAFVCDEATFFAWRDNDDPSWHSTSAELLDAIDDGSSYLLEYLKLLPEEFKEWAQDNYETDVDLDFVSMIYNFDPLSSIRLKAFQPCLDIGRLRQQAIKIGYPIEQD